MIINNHHISPIDYYNEVAAGYNIRQTASDWIIREKVSKLFMQYITEGNVLDFGGGTGLDMPWLMQAGYHVYFLEPSVNMRLAAKQTQIYSANNDHVTFIETLTDFCQWTPENIPFDEKINGILLNFAVFNSIRNPHLFFKKIRMICKEGCYLMMNVTNARPGIVLKRYGISQFVRHIIRGKSAFDIHFNGLAHKTFIYSLRNIRNSARGYFDFISCQSVDNSDFMIVILSAK